MRLSNTVSALGLVLALAAAPSVAFSQTQAAKTGTGGAAGVTAGQEGADGGISTGAVVAGVAIAAAVAIAIAAAGDDDDATTTATSTTTATATQTN